MKISDFKGKKITVMGLGIVGGGVGVVKFLAKAGAEVLVTDLKAKKELASSLKEIKNLDVKLVLGKHRKEDFIKTDMIVRNPGVPDNSPYLKVAKSHKILIENDISIFFQLCPAPIIGITGTKGKSTVATLIYRLLKAKYPDVILAGNIGTSPLESLNKIQKNSKVVLELSSWQLEGLEKHKISPEVAVITNIYPDHLNRYKNLKEYIRSKKIIFRFQKRGDILFLNYDNLIVRSFAKEAWSKVIFYSIKRLPKDFKKIKIIGEHNISNALAAYNVAKFYKVSFKSINKILRESRGVAGRQELRKVVGGVKYFNDTTATMPEATIAAIKTLNQKFLKSKIILISGGVDKNLNYRALSKEINRGVSHLILFSGSASDKIEGELKKLKPGSNILSVLTGINSMKDAIRKAKRVANRGDIVLLSPAAASFNLFKNEFDRGEQFNKIVGNLKN